MSRVDPSKIRLTIFAVALAMVANANYARAQVSDELPLAIVEKSTKCTNFQKADDETLEPFVRWLAGYRDGVAALAVFDKRLAEVKVNILAVLVLSACHAKPDRSIGEVANEMLQVIINHEPGPRLNLDVSKQTSPKR